MSDHNPISTATPTEPKLRWEWRSFEYKPHLWQEAMAGSVRTTPLVMTSEIYLPTRRSPCNVKIRHELLDVKQLRTTDAAGLELWEPTLKCGFPLPPETLDALCHDWQCLRPDTVPSLPTPEHLLSFISRSLPDVRIVPLRKWRRRIRLADCDGERVTILIEGRLLESLSLEHQDPAVLLAALKALRLDQEENTNYLRAIKGVLGWLDT